MLFVPYSVRGTVTVNLTSLFRRPIVVYPLIILVSLYGYLIYVALHADSMIFLPQRPSYTGSDFGSKGPLIRGEQAVIAATSETPFQLHKIDSEGHTITALYLPKAGAPSTLLMSHGNAEDIGENLELYAEYWRRGFAVFAYDYRGYGTSEGKPSEAGAIADEHAAWKYLTENLKVAPHSVIIHGTSVGCGPAVELAEELSTATIERRPAALILRSPFATAFTVLTRIPLLPWDKFDNASRIKKVKMPVLVIHGTTDEVIPFRHGQKVFRNAPPHGDKDATLTAEGGKQHLWIQGAGHNDIFEVAWKTYFDKVEAFAKELPK